MRALLPGIPDRSLNTHTNGRACGLMEHRRFSRRVSRPLAVLMIQPPRISIGSCSRFVNKANNSFSPFPRKPRGKRGRKGRGVGLPIRPPRAGRLFWYIA